MNSVLLFISIVACSAFNITNFEKEFTAIHKDVIVAVNSSNNRTMQTGRKGNITHRLGTGGKRELQVQNLPRPLIDTATIAPASPPSPPPDKTNERLALGKTLIDTATIAPASPPSPPPDKNNVGLALTISGIVSSLLLVASVFACWWCCCRTKPPKSTPQSVPRVPRRSQSFQGNKARWSNLPG